MRRPLFSFDAIRYVGAPWRISYGMAWREELERVGRDMSLSVEVWAKGCVVQGHRGLFSCTPTAIEVRRRHGRVEVQGEDLSVAAVTRDEVWIAGAVKAVIWHD